jgi:hydrogenase-4 transcriptional activator
VNGRASFLLRAWLGICRPADLQEGIAVVAPLLAEQLPLEGLFVRQLDRERSCLATVVARQLGSDKVLPPDRTECSAEEMQHLLLWARTEQVVHHDGTKPADLTVLLPSGVTSETLIGPLNAAETSPACLIAIAAPGQRFRAEHIALFGELLAPFGVALAHHCRLRELTSLREAAEADRSSLLSRLERHDISDSIIGAETGLRTVMQQVELVASSDAPVLILGETGSGKEVVARAIHARSRRAAGPCLRVNCGAMPPELIDSELFGHERGSFSGAVGTRRGWFERADGGTLFLDECGELPPGVQVRLLRILQDGTFERVGGEGSQRVSVRIVAATHRDLRTMVAEGRFREDLWYRLAVFPIQLPPLRERREDMAAMATHFALRAARRLGAPPLVPTMADIGLLLAYSWPGNVRELAAVIERAAILGGGKRLELAQSLGALPVRPTLPMVPAPSGQNESLLPTLDVAMAHHIETALTRARGRIEGPDGAAELLAINPHTLRARMRKLGIQWQTFRPSRRKTAAPQDGRQARPAA